MGSFGEVPSSWQVMSSPGLTLYGVTSAVTPALDLKDPTRDISFYQTVWEWRIFSLYSVSMLFNLEMCMNVVGFGCGFFLVVSFPGIPLRKEGGISAVPCSCFHLGLEFN